MLLLICEIFNVNIYHKYLQKTMKYEKSNNFDSCLNTILKSIFKNITEPLNFAMKTIKKLINLN